jgi:hypothetical protein
MPSEQLLTDMGKYNEELAKAGVLLAGEGLHPIAGFWLFQVPSRDAAIAWVKRCPFDGEAQIEIRQVFEADDFGPALTPELRAAEARRRAQTGQR